MLKKLTLLLVTVVVIFGLGACANTPIEHGVLIKNAGAEPLYDVNAQYSGHALFLRATPKMAPGSELQTGVYSPVQSELRVTWNTDAGGHDPHELTIPLRDKQSLRKLAKWVVLIRGDRLELLREDVTGPMNPNTYLIPRQRVKVFP